MLTTSGPWRPILIAVASKNQETVEAKVSVFAVRLVVT